MNPKSPLKSCLWVFAVILTFALTACSGTARLKPVNAINEPVFYAKPYATLGVGTGVEFPRGGAYSGSNPDRRNEFYVAPTLNWFYPVNSWAGFYLIPVYWNFLLTGNQYADTGFTTLKSGKLHLAASGGLSSASYSGRDGWVLDFSSALQGKYRFNERVFALADYHATITNKLTAATDGWDAGLGLQLTPAFSLVANYAGTHLTLSDNRYVTVGGIDYVNGDFATELSLSTPWYPSAKHIVTPEIGYGFRNQGGTDGTWFRAGLQYRFVFD